MSSKLFLQQRQLGFFSPQYSHLPVNPGRIKHKPMGQGKEEFFWTDFAELPNRAPIQELAYLVHFSLMGLSALLLQN